MAVIEDLVDHSPHQPVPRTQIPTASNVILIDNYDSFTWNVYQYLKLEGAAVTVFRNDEVSLEQLIEQKPTHLVVSPGPGHPDKDAGISNDAIRHFAGKIPVLGVCLGEQCMYSVFGGTVDVTGEILHGKTSPLSHDGRGMYANLPQEIPVTRYHSLAGTHHTLPECLEMSSWVKTANGTHTVVMGIRHKEYTVEGVQFHPESILTAEGRPMLYKFLTLVGGTWEANKDHQTKQNGDKQDLVTSRAREAVPETPPKSKQQSILEQIYDHRRAAVNAQKQIPSQRLDDFQAAYDLHLAPPQIDFPQRLKVSPYPLSLMAEIKRASPSKGIISLDTCAPAQARDYALAGASVISVLTEPEWFKGSIDDLRTVRQALQGMPNRPAILRKEFIFDEYQILEARLAGADTVLLIVKMLDQPLLERLYKYSQSLGMEPLVEVNNVEEMETAVKLGSKVIGVNNRNLTNFEVDLETTSRLMSLVPADTVVCALSGIASSKDVAPYLQNGVGAVLVGEALMRAPDTTQFVKELLAADDAAVSETQPARLLVKICGTRSPEAAKAAIDAGADLIGIILVPGRKRCVSTETALAIGRVVRETRKPDAPSADTIDTKAPTATTPPTRATASFTHTASTHLTHPSRALLVGVFQNQPLSTVLATTRALSLDVVQLHGAEPLEWASLLPVPVIRAFSPAAGPAYANGIGTRGAHALPLLDAGKGGSGERLELAEVRRVLRGDGAVRALLAGGLNAENVAEALGGLGEQRAQVVGVDVGSGVEGQDGEQDLKRIAEFVRAARSA